MTTTQRTLVLERFIEERRGRPFAWGAHDCCLMAADWVREVAGVDYAADLRGTYQTDMGALRRARARWGGTALPDLFGCERWPETAALVEIQALCAQRGDLVSTLSHAHGGLEALVTLGVCCGAQVAAPGAGGLEWIHLAHWRKAWRVAP